MWKGLSNFDSPLEAKLAGWGSVAYCFDFVTMREK
jgi:hypothetical protein